MSLLFNKLSLLSQQYSELRAEHQQQMRILHQHQQQLKGVSAQLYLTQTTCIRYLKEIKRLQVQLNDQEHASSYTLQALKSRLDSALALLETYHVNNNKQQENQQKTSDKAKLEIDIVRFDQDTLYESDDVEQCDVLDKVDAQTDGEHGDVCQSVLLDIVDSSVQDENHDKVHQEACHQADHETRRGVEQQHQNATKKATEVDVGDVYIESISDDESNDKRQHEGHSGSDSESGAESECNLEDFHLTPKKIDLQRFIFHRVNVIGRCYNI